MGFVVGRVRLRPFGIGFGDCYKLFNVHLKKGSRLLYPPVLLPNDRAGSNDIAGKYGGKARMGTPMLHD